MCFSELQRLAAAGVDSGQAERPERERGQHVRRGQQAGVHSAQRLLQVGVGRALCFPQCDVLT